MVWPEIVGLTREDPRPGSLDPDPGKTTPAGVFGVLDRSIPSSVAPPILRREASGPAGGDASAGSYVCAGCGFPLVVASADQLLPCRCCHGRHWRKVVDHPAATDQDAEWPADGAQPWAAGSGDR